MSWNAHSGVAASTAGWTRRCSSGSRSLSRRTLGSSGCTPPWAHQQAEVGATELAHHIRILNSDHRHGAALPHSLGRDELMPPEHVVPLANRDQAV